MTHDKDADWDNMEWNEELGEFVSTTTAQAQDDQDVVVEIKDSMGKILSNGDTVVLTRDLDVKGVAIKLKRGDKVKVKIGDDPELIECKVGKSIIFLKTCFLKKV